MDYTEQDNHRFGNAETLDKDTVFQDRLKDMFQTLQSDRELLTVYKDYVGGKQGNPVAPQNYDANVEALARRSRMNLIRLAVNIPAQVSYIDGFSRKAADGSPELEPPEWEVWHDSNMPAKQTRLFIASLTYGAGYTMLSNPGTDQRRIDLLSARNTVTYFDDPVNDVVPTWALTIKSWPAKKKPGRAVYMDAERIVYLNYTEDGKFTVSQNGDQPHGLGMTPCVRWPSVVDDEGNVEGVVGPLIASQDRVNQTIFDLLNNQSFNAWKLRYITGVAGKPKMHADGVTPVTDAGGNQVYEPIEVGPRRWLATENAEARIGSLEETPQDGFIKALQEAVKDFAVEGQLPPHSLLGSMANLSAETLQALMSQTMRFTKMLKGSWGDAARTQMMMVARDMGMTEKHIMRGTEMRWRDLNDNTLSAIVDALGKAAEMLGVPGEALWSKFPGVTDSELAKWREIRDEQQRSGWLEDFDSPEASVGREGGGEQLALPIPEEPRTPEREAA